MDGHAFPFNPFFFSNIRVFISNIRFLAYIFQGSLFHLSMARSMHSQISHDMSCILSLAIQLPINYMFYELFYIRFDILFGLYSVDILFKQCWMRYNFILINYLLEIYLNIRLWSEIYLDCILGYCFALKISLSSLLM